MHKSIVKYEGLHEVGLVTDYNMLESTLKQEFVH